MQFRKIIVPSVVGGLAAYGYAQTENIFLLLITAWFAAIVAWNILEAFLESLGNRANAIGRYFASDPIQWPVIGIVVGIFSVAANFVIQAHWFLLAHGIFWIFLAIFLLVVMSVSRLLVTNNGPGANRESYFRNELRPAFEALGVQAQNVLSERLEKNITSIWRGRSFAFIELANGPIRWVNFKENRSDEYTQLNEYGVPTYKVSWSFPKVRIKSVRVRSAPLVGNIVDVGWRGKDCGLGLIDRLNGDVSLRQPMLNGFGTGYLKGDVRIDAHPKNGCWLLTEKTRSVVPSRELWDCYEAIANLIAAVDSSTANDPFSRPSRESMELVYGPAAERVIPIGPTPARIISVSQEYVQFVDEAGESHSIDLEECRRNYDVWFTEGIDKRDLIELVPIAGRSENADLLPRDVGFHGALDHPPWMGFSNEPPIMFEFRSRYELEQQILGPLAQFGWNTFGVD